MTGTGRPVVVVGYLCGGPSGSLPTATPRPSHAWSMALTDEHGRLAAGRLRDRAPLAS